MLQKTMDTNDLSDFVIDICHYIGNNYHNRLTRELISHGVP